MNWHNRHEGSPHVEGGMSFLQKHPLFQGVPEKIIKLAAYLAKKEKYSTGQAILLQGTRADRLYFILSGKVALCEEHNGEDYYLQEVSPDREPHCFGELALLARFQWFFSAYAVTDTVLLSLSREAFQKIMEHYPGHYQEMVEKIIQIRVQRHLNQTCRMLKQVREEHLQTRPIQTTTEK